jgi:hypothetical protein
MSSFQAQKIKASWIQVSFTLAAMPLGKHRVTLCSDPSRLKIREHVLWWQSVSDKLSLPNLGAPFAPDFGKEQLVKTYAIRLHYLHRHAILILMKCPLQPKLHKTIHHVIVSIINTKNFCSITTLLCHGRDYEHTILQYSNNPKNRADISDTCKARAPCKSTQ